MGIPIPIIGPIIEDILGIGKTAADRLIPDKKGKQDQDHEERQTQAAITQEGEKSSIWTPRKILMMILAVPVALQLAVKPTVEWVSIVIGHPIVLPSIDIAAALKFLLGLLGLDFS